METKILIDVLKLVKPLDSTMIDILESLSNKIKITSTEDLIEIFEQFQIYSRLVVFQKLLSSIHIQKYMYNTGSVTELPIDNLLELEISSTPITQQTSKMNLPLLMTELLEKNIIPCTHTVEAAVICSMFPECVFDVLSKIKGNALISDNDKIFIITQECLTYMKIMIEKECPEKIAECLSKFFCNTKCYEKCCDLLGMNKSNYVSFSESITIDNKTVIIFENVYDMTKMVQGLDLKCRILHNNNIYVASYKKTTNGKEERIALRVVRTDLSGKEVVVNSGNYCVTRGMKINIEEIVNKSLKSYHLK